MEEKDELHDGYWYNGESATLPPVENLKYRWMPTRGNWNYIRLSDQEIVCTISTFLGYYAHYPVMKSYGSLDAARRAVEEHFGR